MERTSRFAPSRCQVLRGPVRPPEDGCGTCLAAGSHVPRRGRFPACPARLDGPSRHHRNAPMSLVESPVRQATHAPRFQPTGYAPELPARAAPTALRGHVDLLLDRNSVVSGKSVSTRDEPGGSGYIKKTKQ